VTTRTRTPTPPTRTVDRVIEHGGNGEDTHLLVDDLADRARPRRTVRTLVAMPAYNEEAYIAKTIVGARQHADRVLVVDDGSQDDTVPIAEALGAIVIRHTANKGYGGALQTIFATAREIGAEELVIIDSDGQHSPGDIPNLLAELRRGNDVVIGSRFVEGSAGEIPAYRKVGMKVLDTATTMAGNNLTITDSQSGFRAYGRKAIEAIRISGEGMSAGSEILIQISDHRLQVAEVPIKVRYDIEGTSSENPVSHGVGVLMNIVRLISLRRPLTFFGIPGVFFTLFGIGAEIYTFSEYYRSGQFHYIIFTGGFSVLILGLLLATVGIILYSLVQIIEQGSGGKKTSAAAAGSPVGQGAGKAEQGTSH
jgi:glycosyltransferase involved in cell wall biosynthesis